MAKTLTNATANPFLAGGAGSYNPVLALDVFLVQVGPLLPNPVGRPSIGVTVTVSTNASDIIGKAKPCHVK